MALYLPSGKHVRESLLAAMFFLPEDRRVRLNRWLRGRHEYYKLRHADADAVSFADYENMKKLEASGGLGADDRRITPVDRDDPNTYKVRRAKVGGYRDYFTDEEVAAIDDLVATRLAPEFG